MDQPGFVSMAFDDIPRPDFADVAVVFVPGTAALHDDPAWWVRQVFDVRPVPWVAGLFALRQALVGLIGVSRGSGSSFDVRSVRGDEALVGTDENHLDFRAAVAVDHERRLLRVTTAVRLHGWRGRLYFAPVRLLHAPIVQAMTSRAACRAAG